NINNIYNNGKTFRIDNSNKENIKHPRRINCYRDVSKKNNSNNGRSINNNNKLNKVETKNSDNGVIVIDENIDQNIEEIPKTMSYNNNMDSMSNNSFKNDLNNINSFYTDQNINKNNINIEEVTKANDSIVKTTEETSKSNFGDEL